ncbi:MAG: phosphate ABC transporter permease PstA [Erwinia billingiae]|jgi:phosphate transport system permease protein|uniref:Phosphate transport system permease protein PstA n=1 Tax=Erwinia billingiae (strain Eb661) TaxID=634500 RepID=D8MVN1_ERWBE|nr:MULTISPECIES: phosphate ABC transporter permease PstA [Erwinia]QBR48706.1 phosphate ABC transporter permease PstA [Erwinia sp. QL-Z3]QEW31201.1 phosphate ABC transporter permease PstA [Erwinia billingiae]CAX60888.1 Phosphate ABC transporter, permease subunit [Erwinia billingiae Eb661]
MSGVMNNHRWRWLTGGAVAVSLLAFILLIALLAWQGMKYFWPHPVTLYTVQQTVGTTQMLGEVAQSQTVSRQQLEESGRVLPAGLPQELTRYLIKTGNRDFAASDFHSILSSQIVSSEQPTGVIALQRRTGGMAYGWFDGLLENGQPLVARNMMRTLQQRIKQSQQHMSQAEKIRRVSMARLNSELEQLAQQQRHLQQQHQYTAQAQSIHQADSAELQRQFVQKAQQLSDLNDESSSTVLILRDAQGQQHRIAMNEILGAWYPNAMSYGEKWLHLAWQIWHFVSGTQGDSLGEGGVFPAIFGTVLMVLLMSIVVMPLGVIAAIWLHEYAGNGLMTRLVRIAVVNLAGVPSIVYGVFGLGFFVWLVGGSLDKLFFADALPDPTFGTPGLLWASLTLALLTLPVVIVATEEGLSRIPKSLRQGSLALGATQAETLWHVTLPLAVPAMLTGLILAVARAAGETAPLMLVGVVKMVPELPIDAVFPYLHLDRKFMHLGFQIYDLAFQSPNAQADRPLVFATALLLVTIILALNLLAMVLRHRLRERYRALMN